MYPSTFQRAIVGPYTRAEGCFRGLFEGVGVAENGYISLEICEVVRYS